MGDTLDDKLQSRRDLKRIADKKYQSKYPEKSRLSRNKASKKWADANKERKRNRHYLYEYGITLEDAQKLLVGPCPICGQPKTRIDHDHVTGAVRGGLCNSCNSGLGFFKDNVDFLQKAIEYMNNTKKAGS